MSSGIHGIVYKQIKICEEFQMATRPQIIQEVKGKLYMIFKYFCKAAFM
jgi:hypothetical protein